MHRPQELKEIFSEIVVLLQRNVIAPIKPVAVLSVSDFTAGLRKLKSGDNGGKVMVTFGENESALAESTIASSPVGLKPNATSYSSPAKPAVLAIL